MIIVFNALEEITEEALMLKTGEAAGPDGITNTCIKLGLQKIQRHVFYLFNLCFVEHNGFPNSEGII